MLWMNSKFRKDILNLSSIVQKSIQLVSKKSCFVFDTHHCSFVMNWILWWSWHINWECHIFCWRELGETFEDCNCNFLKAPNFRFLKANSYFDIYFNSVEFIGKIILRWHNVEEYEGVQKILQIPDFMIPCNFRRCSQNSKRMAPFRRRYFPEPDSCVPNTWAAPGTRSKSTTSKSDPSRESSFFKAAIK